MITKVLIAIIIAALVLILFFPQYNPLSNAGAVQLAPFTIVDHFENSDVQKAGLDKKADNESVIASVENQRLSDKIVDKILKNTTSEAEQELNTLISKEDTSSLMDMGYTNPLVSDVNSYNQDTLGDLMAEVNGKLNTPEEALYHAKAKGKNQAPADKYRKISYADADYRHDWENKGVVSSQELDQLFNKSNIFTSDSRTSNNDFSGFEGEGSDELARTDMEGFANTKPKSQQQKVKEMFNTDNYLPNKNLLDKDLTKGFQILDNPVSVDNPNLIPVLRSIPVSSVMGSNKNSSYDIRAEPPNPKMAISPFMNSSIMPNMYTTNRSCL